MKPQEAIDAYAEWIRSHSSSEVVGDYVKITTLFLDRHSDYFDFYVREKGGWIELTDDGYLVSDLTSSGFDLNNRDHTAWLCVYWQGRCMAGDTLGGGTITMRCKPIYLGQRVHDLIEGLRNAHHQWISPYEEGGKP